MANLSIPGAGGGSSLTKATGAEINTGTDDAKYITAKAITDSNVAFLSDIPAGATPGTFTPVLVSSGGGAPTYSAQIGRHCDVGNRCFFEARIILTNLGTLAAGNLTIEGMPHTAANITNNITSVSIYATNAQATAVQQLMAGVVPNTATVRLVRYSAGSLALMTVADINTTFAVSISGSFEY